MRSSRTFRTIAVLASIGLIMGAFAATPADAKKKKKKKKKPAACATFVPSDRGAGAPVTVITDAATAEKPVEVAVETAPGLGFSSEEGEGNPNEFGTTHAYTNVQVDSSAPITGLFVTVEFEPVWDYDLWLRDPAMTPVAYSAGSSPPTPLTDGTGHGGHSEVGSENIDGYAAYDCDGFTVDLANAAGPGGEVTVKFWLGEPATS